MHKVVLQDGRVWTVGRAAVRGASWQRSGYALIAVVALGLALHAPASASSIGTYVGGGNGDGGPAIDASFDPRGIIVVGSTEVYFADGRNNRIRHIDRSGQIETIAGTGEAGSDGDGGNALSAELNLPLDVARDSAGNLYIADMNNNRVRKVTPNGQISTFAGNGSTSFSGDNGPATAAALNNPYGVAVGPDGYVYIADLGNNRIRKVGPAGCAGNDCIISTVVGIGAADFYGDNGPPLKAALRNPADVTFDNNGNMLIADFGNHRIRRVSDGIITTVAGGGYTGIPGQIGDGGLAILAVIRYPSQVAVTSDGTILIADSQQYRIRSVHPLTQIITTVAGNGTAGVTGDGGPATTATIFYPWGVAASGSSTFYVSATTDVLAKSLNNRIRKVSNGIISAFAGGGLGDGGAAYDALIDPRGAAATSSSAGLPQLYFADGVNNIVRWVDGETGTIHNIAGTSVKGYDGDGGDALEAKLNSPLDVAVDSIGNVYIADTSNHSVRMVSTKGIITTIAGNGSRGSGGDGGPASNAQLASPSGIAVDSAGRLFIADSNNYRVRMVADGIITTVAGINGQPGSSGDGGAATAAKLKYPFDVAVSGGNLYISDLNDHKIRRVDKNGIISTYAGGGISGFAGDGGPATAAKLSYPTTLSIDDGGRLFIGDTRNYRIRMINASGVITTAAGNGMNGYSGDGGSATAASFSEPSGVAIDPSGQLLFISSKDDKRVRIVDLDPSGTQPTPTRTPTSIPPTLTFTPTRTNTSGGTPTRTATRTNTPGNQTAGIAGSITYYMGNHSNVSAVTLSLDSASSSTTTETNSRGDFGAVVQTGTWSIQPSKTGGFSNAISSLDAARVLQVLAGLATFNAQQRLACDTTGDGTLSSLDAVNILKFSAGVISRLPVATACQSDWLFYPTPEQVDGQQIAYPALSGGNCQQGSILYNPLSTTVANQDFSAMLLGDCTGNWTSGASLRRSAAATVHAGVPRSARGGVVRVPIYVQSTAPFQALDLRLRFDADAGHLIAVRPTGLAAEAMVTQRSSDGTLSVSLASAKPITASQGTVLMLEFRVDSDADLDATLVGALVDESPASVVNHAR
jgi:sugar lactone lactonase YvrE